MALGAPPPRAGTDGGAARTKHECALRDLVKSSSPFPRAAEPSEHEWSDTSHWPGLASAFLCPLWRTPERMEGSVPGAVWDYREGPERKGVQTPVTDTDQPLCHRRRRGVRSVSDSRPPTVTPFTSGGSVGTSGGGSMTSPCMSMCGPSRSSHHLGFRKTPTLLEGRGSSTGRGTGGSFQRPWVSGNGSKWTPWAKTLCDHLGTYGVRTGTGYLSRGVHSPGYRVQGTYPTPPSLHS